MFDPTTTKRVSPKRIRSRTRTRKPARKLSKKPVQHEIVPPAARLRLQTFAPIMPHPTIVKARALLARLEGIEERFAADARIRALTAECAASRQARAPMIIYKVHWNETFERKAHKQRVLARAREILQKK